MRVLKEYEDRLKRLWDKVQQADQSQRTKLMDEYQKLYRSYKIQQLIVEG